MRGGSQQGETFVSFFFGGFRGDLEAGMGVLTILVFIFDYVYLVDCLFNAAIALGEG